MELQIQGSPFPLPFQDGHITQLLSKSASSVDFVIVGDAANRRVGDLQSVTGPMSTGGHGVSCQGPESNRGKCLFSGSGALGGPFVTPISAERYICPCIVS